MSRFLLSPLLASSLLLGGCAAQSQTAAPVTAQSAPVQVSAATAADIGAGKSDVVVYDGWMSPQQQPGEDTDAPKALAHLTGLESTAKPVPREQRKSLGKGRIRFAKNLSRAFVDVEIEGVDPADILMFHVHCGPPGVLGPIIVDFSTVTDLKKSFSQGGKLSVELKNKDIVYVKDMPHGMKPALPESCPVDPGWPTQAMTVAAMEYLARKGVLYFNLHTKAHTFYGEVRGQIYPAKE
jgi:hypothetical protein